MFDLLNALRASSIQGVGTEYGTAIDIGPLGVTKAICNVTVVESGATLAVNLQGSDDNTTFYDIPGTDFLDPADGAAIDAIGRYEVHFKTNFRYIRHKAVVATDEITHEIYLTKSP